ncbi:MAG: YadA-like family protein [Pseudomonadota bacterium]
MALGLSADSSGDFGTALGALSVASTYATAVGVNASATGSNSTALGRFANAFGLDATSLGAGSAALGKKSVAIGFSASAGSSTSGTQAFALGSSSVASADNSTALGGAIDLNGDGTIESGEYTLASAGLSMALGSAAQATQTNATAVGGLSQATGAGATALGSLAEATGSSAVAIGYGSIADAASTVSVGTTSSFRRIVNVADPTGAHDAMTLGYFNTHVSSLFAEINQLQGQLAGLDSSPQTMTTAAPPAPQQAGSVPGTAPPTADAATLAGANAYTDQQTQEALSSAKTYTDAQGAQTLSSAKAYTDAAVADVASDLSAFEQQTNARFNEQDRRIDRLGAMGEASSHMAMSAAGAGENGRLAAGVGFYNDQAAVSVGYARSLGAHATFNVGASASSSEVSGGVGFGVDLP